MSRSTSGAPRAVLAVLVGVLAVLVAGLVSPVLAAGTTSIKGVVTLEGKPVSFARVQLYRDISRDVEHPVFRRVKTANTDSAGRYTISGFSLITLPKDSRGYRVVVTDRPGKVLKTVRVIKPKKGKTVTRNVTASRGAIVTGKVTRADGGDPRALSVLVESPDGRDDAYSAALAPNTIATIASNGTFTIGGVAPGGYDRVRVEGGPYARQCYDFTASTLVDCPRTYEESQALVLTEGERRALPAVTVTKRAPATSTLTGKVTDTSGRSLKGIQVSLREVSGASAPRPVKTRSSGRFTLPGATSGTYVVRFDDRNRKPVWDPQYLGGTINQYASRRITVVGGKAVSGLDAELKSSTTTKTERIAGKGFVTFRFAITRLASGSGPGGTMTLTDGDRSKTVPVVKGKGSIKLSGLEAGSRTMTATYSGTSSTASYTRNRPFTVD